MRIKTAQKVPFIQSGVKVSSKPAGLVTNTVPHRINNTTEKTRMIHFAALPRYVPESSAMDAPL